MLLMKTAVIITVAGLLVLATLTIIVKRGEPDPKDCNRPYPMAFFCSGKNTLDKGGIDRVAVAGRVL